MKIRFEGTVEVQFDDKKLDELIEKFVSCIKRCDMGYVPGQPHPDATPDEDYPDVDLDATLDEDPDVDLFAPLDDDCVDATRDEDHVEAEPDAAPRQVHVLAAMGKTEGKQCRHRKSELKPGRTEQEVEVFENMLEEIAKNAESFEQFVENVAQQLELGKQQEFFQQAVFTAIKAKELTWSAIARELGDTRSRQAMLSPKLKKKKAPNTLYLLNMLIQYKDYPFWYKQSEGSSAEQVAEETVIVIEEETSGQVEDATSKNRVKMECMPEIPWFEETLGGVDKTQPIEDRVRYVLTAMGMEKMNAQEQQEIFEIANTAVRLGRIAFDIIFVKANIPMESSMEARMTFSKFINDFASKHDSEKKVKLLDFLKDLQKIVMYESEIESFTDFTEM